MEILNKYYLAAFTGVFLTTLAQLLLKQGAIVRKEGHILHRFMNYYSVAGYILFIAVTILNLFALQKIKLIDMVFITPLNYIFIIAASLIIFKEKLSRKQVIGIIVIISGIFIFNLNYF